jgi:SAM-dependent methyltransferase
VTEPDFVQSTRASYDAVADEYAAYVRDELMAQPWERAVLSVFAELVRADGAGPVADVGCGEGRVTAHLRGLGLDVFGIDLSPGMLAVARRAHPDVRFDVGSMLALDLPDGVLAGAVAYYSTPHVPDDRLPAVLAEFCRVLAPGGYLLLAFQVGDEPLRLAEAFGRPVVLEFHRRRPERMAALLDLAGFIVRSQLVREPDAGERTAQAYLVAQKPAGLDPG